MNELRDTVEPQSPPPDWYPDPFGRHELRYRSVDRAGNAHRNAVPRPVGSQLLRRVDHLRGRQIRP